jgi:hypothetical protein
VPSLRVQMFNNNNNNNNNNNKYVCGNVYVRYSCVGQGLRNPGGTFVPQPPPPHCSVIPVRKNSGRVSQILIVIIIFWKIACLKLRK